MGAGRIQTAIFAAIGIALLLLGVRAVREPGADPPGAGAVIASEPVGGGSPAVNGDVVVHVAGRVSSPGVYRLPAGSRVADAVERAGGPSGRGDPDAINLAARLADGQQVVVPAHGGTGGADASEDGPISLGSADQADLESIEGIGPVTAADIVAFRDEHGGVSSIEELDAIPGIGPATIESLSDRLQP
jgi:competence protein ComEA